MRPIRFIDDPRKSRAWLLAALMPFGLPQASADWFETRLAIETMLDDEEYEAAADLADRYLDEIATEFGAASSEVADAELFLAQVEIGNGDFPDAENRILESIAIYQELESTASPSLIEPYSLLGEVLYAQRALPEALEAFDMARQIGRRNFGLLNEDQFVLLEQMAQTAYANGDRSEAEALRGETVRIVQRIHGEASLEFIEASFRYADWLRGISSDYSANSTMYELWSTIDDIADEDPILAINALRLYAQRSGRNLEGPLYGTNLALGKAIRLVRRLEEPNPLLYAEILRDLGDWNLVNWRFDITEENYVEASALLDEVENGAAIRREWFGEPSILRASAMRITPQLASVLKQTPESTIGRIELEFDVDSYGRPLNIRVVDARPASLFESAAMRAVSSFSFRPAMDNGRLVTGESRYAWEFYYDPAGAELLSSR